MLGRYPTPVVHLAGLSTSQSALWVKRDDLSGELYGGNKVRKLEHLLEEARRLGAKRLLTVGAAGSHHVLACATYGQPAGFDVAALLIPQPHTAHAVDNLRAGLACGLQAIAVPNPAHVPRVLASERRAGDLVIGPGGSSPVGTLGYVDAARELSAQVQAAELPRPDVIVVALGSGGTAAGLLAGAASLGWDTKVVAVRIVSRWWIGPLRVLKLARKTCRLAAIDVPLAALVQRLEVEGGYLGDGYGHGSEASSQASRVAAEHGLSLDPTYTGKAFAAALNLVRAERYRNVLYWHTLSSAPLTERLLLAPAELPLELDALFVRAKLTRC